MAFKTTRRLQFSDCDPSGIAYFPSYLNMLVGVVEEFFAGVGAPWPELIRDQRIGTPTVKLDVAFTRPGFHGDILEFTLRVRRIGRSSLDLHHEIAADGQILWAAEQRLVATSLETHKACSWPDNIRQALAQHLD